MNRRPVVKVDQNSRLAGALHDISAAETLVIEG